ncbi:MAG: AAA family ATPase [Erysipelothrix sp.]|nr:AAA family ATPase [Erysipelothrix sp.]
MFLKRIEMQGFKSFADKVVINFDQPVTGIVGPNGCGKSNIADAIRWVLGEQSAKSLRGTSMADVIFSGTQVRKTVNLAEVTLVFNNQDRHLNTDYEEVEITRKIHRENSEGEYFINKTAVRLKDIQELIMDTGIGRDSLSMISQGNISAFAEARPVDRRALFEEAAGVSKYKKRKIESLSKLSRTQENLERVEDILSELKRQVTPLKKAKDKALKYRELKDNLQKIEIAVLVSDITFFKTKHEELLENLKDLQSDNAVFETSISVHEVANTENKQRQRKLDIEINQLHEEIIKIVNEIQTLETRKIEIDEKRKYLLESGSNEVREKELKALLAEAKFEYEDRLKRFSEIDINIKQYNNQLSQVFDKLINHNQQSEEVKLVLRRLNQRKEVLETMIDQPFRQQQGVRSVLEAKSSLNGVMDVVASALRPIDGYEEAISTALGGAMYHIIVKDPASARNAVNFLKNNKSGRATFLPASVLKERYVRREDEIVMDNTKGFLGLASDFVDCDVEYDIINQSLLANVLVSEDLKDAQELANRLQFRYKIVTLDGEVIHRGGSITGGSIKDSYSPLTMQKELRKIEENIERNNQLSFKFNNVSTEIETTKNNLETQLMNNRINLATLEPIVEAKRSKYEHLQSEYDLIIPKELQEEETFSDELITMLNKSYSKRDESNVEIKSKRSERINLSNEIERREAQIRQIRNQYKDVVEQLNNIKINIARAETKLETDLSRLASEYQMTYERAKANYENSDFAEAKSEVLQLRQAIESLGNVNMSAPEEYAEVSERYEFIKHQFDDLQSSRKNLIEAIDSMDEVMIEKFEDMFHKINTELQGVFSKLFGGGTANLIMEDPDDVLNTGIDIDVKPPGKTVQNIRLFSGGEKALIAISVLFAILKARPVPLCIFDEVEAALDQANVERFSAYLREFSHDTQFIVVTHRPGTMARADVLYGVTMPLEGVSQMLKVELKDAKEYADEVNLNGIS